jgi:hypothetical protein
MATPTALSGSADAEKEGLSAKFAHWMALYAAFLFLAGWTYLKYYFTVFGVNSGWLDFGFNDTLAHGFSVLFGTGALLSIIYVVIFLLTLIREVFLKPSPILDALIPVILVLLFPATYGVARYAGIRQANNDRGEKSSLPTIAFGAGSCDYRGKLVYLNGDLFYISNAAYLTIPRNPTSCPLDLTDSSILVPQLWLVRSSDLKEIRVIRFGKEAKQ